MAGNYPDVPSWRMAYDRDGSQGYAISADLQTITPLTTTQMKSLNDESSVDIVGFERGGYCLIWFPEVRDLDGYFYRAYGQVAGVQVGIETSTNTTNGVDGTWSVVRAYGDALNSSAVSPDYRSGITSATVFGIRAVRVRVTSGNGGSGLFALHLYGEPIPGANPNRLEVWHPTLDQRTIPSHFDWGDSPRSSSADKSFRIKNLSSVQTANSIRIAQEILTDAAVGQPSVVGQHTLSADGGGTFLPQVNIGTLAPGTISSVVTVRRNTPSNAQLGVWAPRIFAEANSWS